MCSELLETCKERFACIDAHLSDSDEQLKEHNQDIKQLSVLTACLNERITVLAQTMRLLTRALWGVAAATLAALFGFLLWYIQTL